MRAADLLLLVANQTPGAEATVPGKLFEYLASGRPLFALAPRESSTADVLARTGGAWLAPSDDASAVARALGDALEAHRTSTIPTPNARAVARFDRRRLAGDLAAIFEEARAARRL
jgi:glycosyltransferase involved in cell wall biosynthesis